LTCPIKEKCERILGYTCTKLPINCDLIWSLVAYNIWDYGSYINPDRAIHIGDKVDHMVLDYIKKKGW